MGASAASARSARVGGDLARPRPDTPPEWCTGRACVGPEYTIWRPWEGRLLPNVIPSLRGILAARPTPSRTPGDNTRHSLMSSDDSTSRVGNSAGDAANRRGGQRRHHRPPCRNVPAARKSVLSIAKDVLPSMARHPQSPPALLSFLSPLFSHMAHIPPHRAFIMGRRHQPSLPSPPISCRTITTPAANPAEKHPRRSGRCGIFCISEFLRCTIASRHFQPSPASILVSLFSFLFPHLRATQMHQMQVHHHPNAGSPTLKKARHINHMHHMSQMRPMLHDPDNPHCRHANVACPTARFFPPASFPCPPSSPPGGIHPVPYAVRTLALHEERRS